MRDSNCILYY